MADPHRTKPDSEYSVATTHTQGRDVSTVYITPAEWERRNNPNNYPQPKAPTAPTAPAGRPRDPNSGLSLPTAAGLNHLRQQGYANGGEVKSKKFTKESNPVSYRLAEKSDQLKKSGDKAAEEGRHVAAAGNYAGSAATFAGSLPALAVEEISRPAYEAYKDWRGEPYGYADGGFVQPHNFINAVGYADGGMVGLQPAAPTNFMNAVGYQNGGGVGMPPNGGNSYASDPSMVDAHINDGFAKNPQVREQIKQIVMEAVQSGELTPQELNQIIQLAKAAQHNPGIWPQLRNFMIQQGADPSEIPEQYDQGLVSIVLIIAKAVEQDLSQGAGGMPQPGMQPPMQMKADGGLIVGPGTGTSDSIPAVNSSDGSPVAVSNGEYVIPASVVQAKGVDFFDGLVRKYHTPNGLKK